MSTKGLVDTVLDAVNQIVEIFVPASLRAPPQSHQRWDGGGFFLEGPVFPWRRRRVKFRFRSLCSPLCAVCAVLCSVF